jgi:hypothetical protein
MLSALFSAVVHCQLKISREFIDSECVSIVQGNEEEGEETAILSTIMWMVVHSRSDLMGCLISRVGKNRKYHLLMPGGFPANNTDRIYIILANPTHQYHPHNTKSGSQSGIAHH